jgi:hypothetical protein
VGNAPRLSSGSLQYAEEAEERTKSCKEVPMIRSQKCFLFKTLSRISCYGGISNSGARLPMDLHLIPGGVIDAQNQPRFTALLMPIAPPPP